jgi:DNA polymerase III delta prime subunit
MSLFTEQYRPKGLDDVKGQPEMVGRFREFLRDPSTLKHLLLSGPPGCGKTSCAIAFGNEARGIIHQIKYINTSSLRTAEQVMKKIYGTCRIMSGKNGIKSVIVCDEADSLTSESQKVIEYCIEQFDSRWVFVLIMNNPDRLITELRVKLEEIRANTTTEKDTFQLTKNILLREHLTFPDELLKSLIQKYRGDMRKIILMIQALRHKYSHLPIVPEWEAKEGIDFSKLEWELKLKFTKSSSERNYGKMLIDIIDYHLLLNGNPKRTCLAIADYFKIPHDDPRVLDCKLCLNYPGNALPYLLHLYYAVKSG